MAAKGARGPDKERVLGKRIFLKEPGQVRGEPWLVQVLCVERWDALGGRRTGTPPGGRRPDTHQGLVGMAKRHE